MMSRGGGGVNKIISCFLRVLCYFQNKYLKQLFLISCFLYVLCYFQHFWTKKTNSGGEGGWVSKRKKISFRVFFIFYAVCRHFIIKIPGVGGGGAVFDIKKLNKSHFMLSLVLCYFQHFFNENKFEVVVIKLLSKLFVISSKSSIGAREVE